MTQEEKMKVVLFGLDLGEYDMDRRMDELSALAEPAAEDAPWDDTPLRAVLSLPRKYREVVLLRYYEEFTLEEIADTLGIVPGTVSARLTRAKRKLRPMLEEWYYD